MITTSPSWYDVLDVDRTASTDEIRAAWKAAIADLDPTDRRFRLANQAAEVLLDPRRRRRRLPPPRLPPPGPRVPRSRCGCWPASPC